MNDGQSANAPRPVRVLLVDDELPLLDSFRASLAREFEVDVREVSEAETRDADEIWITSSTKEVLAVTTLDGKAVGTGKPGPLFRRMHALYQEYKQTVMRRGT